MPGQATRQASAIGKKRQMTLTLPLSLSNCSVPASPIRQESHLSYCVFITCWSGRVAALLAARLAHPCLSMSVVRSGHVCASMCRLSRHGQVQRRYSCLATLSYIAQLSRAPWGQAGASGREASGRTNSTQQPSSSHSRGTRAVLVLVRRSTRANLEQLVAKTRHNWTSSAVLLSYLLATGQSALNQPIRTGARFRMVETRSHALAENWIARVAASKAPPPSEDKYLDGAAVIARLANSTQPLTRLGRGYVPKATAACPAQRRKKRLPRSSPSSPLSYARATSQSECLHEPKKPGRRTTENH